MTATRGTTFDGRDGSGVVQVIVDGTGRPIDFRLERNWRRGLDPRRLGAAVLEAVAAATAARTSVRLAESAAMTVELPRGPIVPNPSPHLVEHLLDLLSRVDREAARPARVTTGSSAGGHIVVTLTGAEVTGVSLTGSGSTGDELNTAFDGQSVVALGAVATVTDRCWSAVANHEEVAAELRSATAAAYREADDAARGRRSATAELVALTADPQKFLDELFGLGH